MTNYGYFYERPKTPKRYFNLGVFSCTLGGLVFTVGIILVVLGSSPYEPEALWISGIVLLLLGGVYSSWVLDPLVFTNRGKIDGKKNCKEPLPGSMLLV
ncbi:uncharacterized protein TNCT_293381 [Trichonephila clavata]|uniref:Uncharacterized protein n=1 Tax=Trichonephila clavata TaxID=2740835 RepID=A0A8X6FPT2_TRICU|nr:uncharacterized protein TNCT_293381 [Trichonephila clavata]